MTIIADAALRVPVVSSAARVISEAAASLDVAMVTLDDEGTETPLPEDPISRLLAGPANDRTSGNELIRDLVIDALARLNRPRIMWGEFPRDRTASDTKARLNFG